MRLERLVLVFAGVDAVNPTARCKAGNFTAGSISALLLLAFGFDVSGDKGSRTGELVPLELVLRLPLAG